MTATVPPTSAETQTVLPSGAKVASRGRVSTSTLASSSKVVLSMKCAMLVVSEVATVIFESGLTRMPSGSRPTEISARVSPLLRSTTVTSASSSLAM